MKKAVIDIGSNSIRLTVYETEGSQFRILFREKIMAGLAGYVENHRLSDAGIRCAYMGLLEFRNRLEVLELPDAAVFATASLRNIENTDEALSRIASASGYDIEILSGSDEALLGYAGAMQEFNMFSGVYADIGGASTEITLFANHEVSQSVSYPVGSLQLYRDCVKKILPGEGSMVRMKKMISEQIPAEGYRAAGTMNQLICVGGTARAVLHLARELCNLPDDTSTLTNDHLKQVHEVLTRTQRGAADFILKLEPERIHTLIPGLMILRHVVHTFGIREIIVSKYGVREGYLCRKLLQQA